MSPARDVPYDSQADEAFWGIEINPPLPCGYNCCGHPARRCLAERNPQVHSLWTMLPVCEEHAALIAASALDTCPTPSRARTRNGKRK